MKLVTNALAVVCAGVVSSAALAEITVDYIGTGNGRSGMGLTYAAGGNANNGNERTFNGWTGTLVYEVTGVDPNSPFASQFSVGQTLNAFCTDFFSSAGSATFMLGDLSDAPQPGSYQMGEDRAALISGLYAAHYDNLGSANSYSAFQLAIWEIAFEDEFDGTLASLDLESGQFFSDEDFATSGSRDTVVALANSMLADAWDAWQNGEGLHLLAAMDVEGAQDFIIVIPLPAPAWMALAGLVGIAALRRRKH